MFSFFKKAVVAKGFLPFSLALFTILATICRSDAFATIRTNGVVQVGSINACQRSGKLLLRNQRFVRKDLKLNVGYEYIPPNPDASPGKFHMPELRSSYPPGTPAGLRGEAIRSVLTTTERCIGWNLSTNTETSMGGLLQISGRGTLDFLNGKLTRDFRNISGNSFREACLLDAKGRLIDVLRVTLEDDNRRALVLTSPGHSSADLLKRLDPFVFPMDEVKLTNFCNDKTDESGDNHSFAFTLASTQYKHVQDVIREQSKLLLDDDEMVFPGMSQGVIWKPRGNTGDNVQILVVPSTGVSFAACVGYTFVFFGSGSDATTLGRQIWEHLIAEDNLEGPVEVGALEYETLRVEAGQPAYGHEYGIALATRRQKKLEQETKRIANDEGGKRKKKKTSSDLIKTSPFELHFNSMVDLDKGCYLGQEGIAAVLRNSRGAPRTLYTVVFQDDFNIYESQSRGDKSSFDNLTNLPRPGQKLYALGSNEELQVGTLTSVGEAGGTGGGSTVGLALIKRADGIQKRMKELDLEIPRDANNFLDVDVSTGSGIIQPPPMDTLEGLEIIVEGTFTVGVLKAIPSRQPGMRRNSNMYDPDVEVESIEDFESTLSSSSTTQSESTEIEDGIDDMNIDDNDLAELEQLETEVAQATAAAEAAAAEAKRKADKMELLKKRADEAMARRKEKADAAAEAKRKAEKMELLKKRADEAMARRKQKAAQKQEASKGESEEDAAAAEAKRKAEKMAMLKKRADEAMARRKAKKEQQSQ